MQMTIEEVITESLEADNLQLQNMSTSKYVQVTWLRCVLGPAWIVGPFAHLHTRAEHTPL